MAPIIPWIGGKRRLVDLLLSRFPSHSCYVEVFAGGAAVFFARHPADVEVLNDVNGDLVNLYRCVKHHLAELCTQFRWMLVARDEFDRFMQTPAETLTDIIQEMLLTRTSERQGRVIDHDGAGSMEDKKRQGYF